ncbi:MAG: Rossmann-like and DUF2520 domain-containing protein [Fidelibacterota bacterium]
MMAKGQSFALIGASRTGLALSRHLEQSGFVPACLWNRSRDKFTTAREFVNFQRFAPDLHEVPPNPDWIIIAVSDDAIRPIAGEIAAQIPDGKGTKVFHLSGARDAGLLAELQQNNFRTGSLHPLISVPDIETGIRMMAGAVFTCEGEIAGDLQSLVVQIGGTGFHLQAEQKSLIHLCAVFVNNFPTAMIQAVKQLLQSRGISETAAATLLGTLSRQAVENGWFKPLSESLTGPIARGDQETIDKHLSLLSENPGLKRIYLDFVELIRSLLP